MEEQIKKLYSEGKSYRQIETILKCSRSLISYYLNPEGKTKNVARRNKNRFRTKSEYRERFGAKCQLCGYNKCQNALHFHHVNPSEKKFAISDSLRTTRTQQEIDDEINKCILVCSNCHVEIHSGIIKLEENGAKDKI